MFVSIVSTGSSQWCASNLCLRLILLWTKFEFLSCSIFTKLYMPYWYPFSAYFEYILQNKW
jgi:hypothetical protein